MNESQPPQIGELLTVDHTETNAAAVDGFLKCFAKDPEIT
jgi:hypothetical protein